MGFQNVKSEVAEALRRYGFYIFDKGKLGFVEEVIKLLRDLGPLVRVGALSQNSNYFILEIDIYAFEASCRERCIKNGVIDYRCFNKCIVDNNKNAVERVVTAISR